MDIITSFLTSLHNQVGLLQPADFIDVAIVTFLIYKGLGFVSRTHYKRYAFAAGVIFVTIVAANLMKLPTISYFSNKGLELGLIALVIIFQPELRRLLERMGSSKFAGLFSSAPQNIGMDNIITQTTLAYKMLSESKTGALMVFERSSNLTEYTNTGTILNADLTSDLIRNIFFEPAPLHDGAVIVREGKITAAGCMLPLSKNNTLSHDLGMRHRAAIGISEASDAVVAIVSEETGAISVAINGMIKRHLDIDTFEAILRTELIHSTEETAKTIDKITNLFSAFKGKKNDDTE